MKEFVRREKEIDDQLRNLRVRASTLGTSTAKYMTHVVMHSAVSHIRENYSLADLMPSDLKFSVDTGTEEASVDEMTELATGDQGKRRRARGARHAEDDNPEDLEKISSNPI